MRAVIGCECSGRTRDSFIAKGWDAISVDLLPSESPGPHFQGDLFDFFDQNPPEDFDIGIFHPDCTYLTLAGARWFHHPDDKDKPESQRRVHPQYPDRWRRQVKAMDFFMRIQELPIPKICIENPIPLGRVKKAIGDYQQRVHPHWFGTPTSKSTCLWLKQLHPLRRTHFIDPKYIRPECHLMPPGPERAKNRSRTPLGLAIQFAAQWG